LQFLKISNKIKNSDKEVMTMLDRGESREKRPEHDEEMLLSLEPLDVIEDREKDGDNPMWAGRTMQEWFFMEE